MQEILPLRGRLNIALNGKTVREIDNLVLTAGTEWVAARMLQSTTALDPKFMGIGTADSVPVAGDVALNALMADGSAPNNTANTTIDSEAFLTSNIKPFMDGQDTPVAVPPVQGTDLSSIVFKCTFKAAEGTGAVREAGLFIGNSADVAGNAARNSVAGAMIARTQFNAVYKDDDDEMTITWTITVAGSS